MTLNFGKILERLKLLIVVINITMLIPACGTNNSNNSKQRMSAEEIKIAKKARIQARLDTMDAMALVGNIRLMMNRGNYEEAIKQLRNETYKIRIADAEFLVRRFETRFNEQDQLVALCLNVSGRYQTIGQYVSGLDDSLVSVEKFLDNNYGEPDSTNCVYQANHIPKEEFREWIFNQRVIVQRVNYSAGEYKGTYENGAIKGKVYEGDADFELWYYSPQYYLNEKVKKEEQKRREDAQRKEKEERERSYSSNL